MISLKGLEDYAKSRGLKNLGHAEKDYFQNILLFIIYNHFGNEVIFKGGTALAKCYGLNRFSEDLDFNCSESFDLKIIENGLKRFKIEYEMAEKMELQRSKSIILRIKGPLFNGTRNSLCKLALDLSFREITSLPPKEKIIGRFLEELPSFGVYAMHEEEILAEKIRAIISRNKARDLFDLYFLLMMDVKIDKGLAKKKLGYYSIEYSQKLFFEKAKDKKNIWNSEMNALVNKVPDFDDVLKKVMHEFQKD